MGPVNYGRLTLPLLELGASGLSRLGGRIGAWERPANSRSQEIGLALGAQAGERRLRQVMEAAGFRQFGCAAQTPFNLVLEAKP